MKKAQISKVLVLALILANLSSCISMEPPRIDVTVSITSTYYSITTAENRYDKNHYRELNIKIPKITYSGIESDALMDSINDEISSSLNKLINEAEKNALNNYSSYLTTAKKNIIIDATNRLKSIKNKYKSIIGHDEVVALNDAESYIASISELANANYRGKPKKQFDNIKKSTSSNFRKNADDSPRDEFRYNDNKVYGHTSTENLIIPELHNKRIIVVETESPQISQTTISIDGRPGFRGDIAPEERSDRATRSEFKNGRNDFVGNDFNKNNFDRNEFIKNDFGKMPMASNSVAELNKKSLSTDDTATPSITKELNEPSNKQSFTTNDIATPTDLGKELSLDDFYKELRQIKMIMIPDEWTLLKEYTPTKINCSFDVKCLDEDYISLFIELTETKTATSVKRFFYNIDLKNKRILKLSDVLGENYKERCVNSITKAIENMTDDEKTNLKNNYNIADIINEDTAFFINNNHLPVIELDKFALTSGYLEFQITASVK